MLLALSRVQHGAEPVTAAAATPLTSENCTIGRSRECDVVLEDTSRHVSRLHATISQRGGAYFLTVNSRVNPVLLNGTAVAAGQSVPLSAGDEIAIGEYIFAVVPHNETQEATKPAPGLANAAAAASGPATLDALFGPHPGAHTPGQQTLRSKIDDLIGGHPAGTDEPLLDVLSGRTPSARPDGVAGAALSHNPNDPLMQLLGQDASLDPAAAQADRPIFPHDAGRGASSIDDLLQSGPVPTADPLGLGVSDHRGRADAFGGGRGGSLELDHVHDVNLPVSLPQSRVREPVPPHTVSPAQPARPAPVARTEPVAPATPAPAEDDPLSRLLNEEPGRQPAPGNSASTDPLGLQSDAGSRSARAPTRPAGPPPAAQANRIAQPPGRDQAPSNVAASASRVVPGDKAAMSVFAQAFLEGAGVTGVRVGDDEAEAFARDCGKVCRAALEGLMGLLLTRATVKKELRTADRTTVSARQNNPLKLVENLDEAIRFMLDPSARTDAFMPPPKAVEDACDDLRAHEIALMVGMRSALLGAIRRFDPAKVERVFEQQGALSLLSNRKAKLWDCFRDLYDKTSRDAEDNFDKVFGTDFMRAYDEQIRHFKKL